MGQEMIAFDTNILIRLITNDDPAQCAKVSKLLENHSDYESIFISDVVLAEVEWVLDYTYGLSRELIVAALSRILNTDQFVFTNKESLFRAITKYKSSRSDFSDAIIGELGRELQAKTYSFDKVLKSDPNFIVL